MVKVLCATRDDGLCGYICMYPDRSACCKGRLETAEGNLVYQFSPGVRSIWLASRLVKLRVKMFPRNFSVVGRK